MGLGKDDSSGWVKDRMRGEDEMDLLSQSYVLSDQFSLPTLLWSSCGRSQGVRTPCCGHEIETLGSRYDICLGAGWETVIVSFSCQLNTNLKSPGKKKLQLKNWLSLIGLWPCLWCTPSIAGWCRRGQLTVNSVIPRQVSLGRVRKLASWACQQKQAIK